jgi:hypothetical protein
MPLRHSGGVEVYSSTHSWPQHYMEVCGQLQPQGKSPWYPLDTSLGGIQIGHTWNTRTYILREALKSVTRSSVISLLSSTTEQCTTYHLMTLLHTRFPVDKSLNTWHLANINIKSHSSAHNNSQVSVRLSRCFKHLLMELSSGIP